ncbi:hypothetical protein L0F63_000935 [Massospora cicadina]|nr:hypothetical protein L0F63_000935 [Massospora cicadina]
MRTLDRMHSALRISCRAIRLTPDITAKPSQGSDAIGHKGHAPRTDSTPAQALHKLEVSSSASSDELPSHSDVGAEAFDDDYDTCSSNYSPYQRYSKYVNDYFEHGFALADNYTALITFVEKMAYKLANEPFYNGIALIAKHTQVSKAEFSNQIPVFLAQLSDTKASLLHDQLNAVMALNALFVKAKQRAFEINNAYWKQLVGIQLNTTLNYLDLVFKFEEKHDKYLNKLSFHYNRFSQLAAIWHQKNYIKISNGSQLLEAEVKMLDLETFSQCPYSMY